MVSQVEDTLRVFENGVLRGIFEPQRDEVTGGWKNLHSEELHASPNIIRMIKSRAMRWAEHVACMGEMRNAYNIVVGKPEGKRSLGRPRHRWEDNIKMVCRKIGSEGVDWFHVAQDKDRWRAVYMVTDFRGTS
jgi:hypothetical protein